MAAPALAMLSIVATLIVVELAFRELPSLLPSGVYASRLEFDPVTRSPVYRGSVIYNKTRRTERSSNSLGFLDVEPPPPREGRRRIGIFGDSYVESAQVPLEQTFFRLLDSSRPDADVMAFGISGWGTLHSMLAWEGLADPLDLDVALYLFVENDPGDNVWSIQSVRPTGYLPRPFAELVDSPPGFRVRVLDGSRESGPIARALRALYDRSLVLRAVWSRIALLRYYGLAARRSRQAEEMTGRAGAIPNQNDLPSSWPESYRREAAQLGQRILAHWSRRASERGTQLVVAYVPRGEAQLRGEIPEADLWRSWLFETCEALGVPVIDLTPALTRVVERGGTAYSDHWSPSGHAAVADALRDAPELQAKP